MPYSPFHFVLMTHEETLMDGLIRSLIVPAQYGSVGILARHAPLVAILVGGALTFETEDGDRRELDITGGILTVGDNEAVVLADQVLD